MGKNTIFTDFFTHIADVVENDVILKKVFFSKILIKGMSTTVTSFKMIAVVNQKL